MVTVLTPPVRSFFLALVFFLIYCAPGVTTKPAVESMPERPVKIFHGDTLVYRIACTGNAEDLNVLSIRSTGFLRKVHFLRSAMIQQGY